MQGTRVIKTASAGPAACRQPSGADRSHARRHCQQTRHAAGACLRGDASTAHAVSIARNGHATNRPPCVYLDDGVMTRQEGKRTHRRSTFPPRRRPVASRQRRVLVAENISDRPIRILEVDLKGPPSTRSP